MKGPEITTNCLKRWKGKGEGDKGGDKGQEGGGREEKFNVPVT